jgi:hypothetical protein
MIRSLSILAIGFELAAGMARAADPIASAPLENLLGRTERRMEQFWDQFSAVTCTETVEQQKLADDGKVLIKRRSSYDYLVLLLLSSGDLTVQESRLLQGKPAKDSDRALLSTSGFSTLALIFHPHFRESFVFSDEGPDPDSPSLDRVHFEHVHGKPTPSVLQLRSRDYPIEWQGTAWIDSASGNIARIQAALKGSLADIGLQKLESDVRYGAVAFAGHPDPPWMPQTASIQADTVHQHWRNLHTFTRYKQFSVSTDSKTETPAEVPKQ